ncbi:AraD1 family protein [Pareuzebyella sediminis]|uniref:AraD1 family protein n=1 Tax=Pareuzebyella sediminis TaxID=2607998 RepID=UPI0011EF8A7E|nr:AraD1 family protein [Pareuzebyella sediminis]
MRIVQYLDRNDGIIVAQVSGDRLYPITNFASTYDLAYASIQKGEKIETLVAKNLSDDYVDYDTIVAADRLLPPIFHKDPYHFWITGTGLTHSGSANARDTMHKALEKEKEFSDSMKIFKMGIEGGKPKKGQIGVQPEWFYKGNGTIIVPPNGTIDYPSYALDGGEEPEIVGIYLIGLDGTPFRVGYALGNEYSDHVMERINYLYLAHSKLRQCSFGPELLIGDLPESVKGRVSVQRGTETLWAKDFLSGAAHMIHSIDNLEQHHFKYKLFRTPGDLHCHYFGTATFSFTDGIQIDNGDCFEIASDVFGKPLCNRVKRSKEKPFEVKAL